MDDRLFFKLKKPQNSIEEFRKRTEEEIEFFDKFSSSKQSKLLGFPTTKQTPMSKTRYTIPGK